MKKKKKFFNQRKNFFEYFFFFFHNSWKKNGIQSICWTKRLILAKLLNNHFCQKTQSKKKLPKKKFFFFFKNWRKSTLLNEVFGVQIQKLFGKTCILAWISFWCPTTNFSMIFFMQLFEMGKQIKTGLKKLKRMSTWLNFCELRISKNKNFDNSNFF